MILAVVLGIFPFKKEKKSTTFPNVATFMKIMYFVPKTCVFTPETICPQPSSHLLLQQKRHAREPRPRRPHASFGPHRAEDAKRFPKAPPITRAGDVIRRDFAQDVPFADAHEHVDVSECDTVGEALEVLDEEITRLAEIKGSLEAFRASVLNEAVGEPVQFEIGGDTNVAPSFSLK